MAKIDIENALKRLPVSDIRVLLARNGHNPHSSTPKADLKEAVFACYRKPNGVYDLRRFTDDALSLTRIGMAETVLRNFGRSTRARGGSS